MEENHRGITGKGILSRIHNVYDPSVGRPPPRGFSPPIDRNYARSTRSNDRTVKAKTQFKFSGACRIFFFFFPKHISERITETRVLIYFRYFSPTIRFIRFPIITASARYRSALMTDLRSL